jgi:hypothetical protein
LAVIATLAGLLHGESFRPGALVTVLAAFEGHKVLWVCLIIAIWQLLRAPAQSLCFRDLVAGGPALLLAATASGIWPWLGLSLSMALLMRGAPERGSRHGYLIALAIGLHEVTVRILGQFMGDALLSIDAWIASELSSWFLPAIQATSGALRQTPEHVVVLVWGCSSLSHLGEGVLLCWALATARRDSGPLSAGAGTLWLSLALVGMVIIGLNALRLGLMATGPAAYEFLHDGDGATLFRMGTLGASIAMAWVYSCDETHRTRGVR